jgi:hypothetical protein
MVELNSKNIEVTDEHCEGAQLTMPEMNENRKNA